jgi:hypothetical protein
VSAIQKEEGDVTGVITTKQAKTLTNRIAASDVKPLTAMFPIEEKYRTYKPVIVETYINARFLLLLTRKLAEFGGESLRLRLTGAADPIQLETRNPKTQQKMECLLMPRNLHIDKERFADPEPQRCGVMSEGAGSQCILETGHKEKVHRMGPLDEEFLPSEDSFEKALRMAAALAGGK